MTARPRGTRRDESFDVLLVEDNPGDVRLVEEALKSTDTQTTLHAFSTGTEAIAALSDDESDALPVRPDIALLDLNLPTKDGCDVLEAIRDDPELEHLPAIMLSSSRDPEDVERCYNADANAYLTKPKDPDAFVSLVEAIEEFWFEAAHLPTPGE